MACMNVKKIKGEMNSKRAALDNDIICIASLLKKQETCVLTLDLLDCVRTIFVARKYMLTSLK
jgi:hypothetical protein